MKIFNKRGKTILEIEAETLSGVDLSGADLYRANLSGANLSGANLYRAKLSRAKLSYAKLSYANLSRANLFGADLSYANLSRANLSRAELSGAKGIVFFGPLASGRFIYAVKHEKETMYKCGCFWGNAEQLEAFEAESKSSPSYNKIIQLLISYEW